MIKTQDEREAFQTWKSIFKMRAEKLLERKGSGLKANTKPGRAAKSIRDKER